MSTPVENHRIYKKTLLEFDEKNKTSQKMRKRGNKIIPEPYYHKHPFYAKSGEGCILTDVDGNRRIDYLNSWSALILGHAHPKVLKVVQDEIKNGCLSAYAAETWIKRRKISSRIRLSC